MLCKISQKMLFFRYILTQASICSETAVRSEADVDALDVTS